MTLKSYLSEKFQLTLPQDVFQCLELQVLTAETVTFFEDPYQFEEFGAPHLQKSYNWSSLP
jgi:hypothetical protein